MSQDLSFQLQVQDLRRLSELCGQINCNLQMIEKELNVVIANRGYSFVIRGAQPQITKAKNVIEDLYAKTQFCALTAKDVHLTLRAAGATIAPKITITSTRTAITTRGDNQQRYLQRIFSHSINFGVGPAGTGKTYLAVAAAVAYLLEEKVRKLVLVRPAVEAGERLGFLPGDINQKVDPYLRPLYDALHDILGAEKVNKLLERNIIEIAPLAFMRGRTLNDAFIILDEAQNSTVEQMKMFLTRQGFGSTSVINGDITQIDLGRGIVSGLKDALQVLDGIEGISMTYFEAKDVVRHPLVQRIIEAYQLKTKEGSK